MVEISVLGLLRVAFNGKRLNDEAVNNCVKIVHNMIIEGVLVSRENVIKRVEKWGDGRYQNGSTSHWLITRKKRCLAIFKQVFDSIDAGVYLGAAGVKK